MSRLVEIILVFVIIGYLTFLGIRLCDRFEAWDGHDINVIR